MSVDFEEEWVECESCAAIRETFFDVSNRRDERRRRFLLENSAESA